MEAWHPDLVPENDRRAAPLPFSWGPNLAAAAALLALGAAVCMHLTVAAEPKHPEQYAGTVQRGDDAGNWLGPADRIHSEAERNQLDVSPSPAPEHLSRAWLARSTAQGTAWSK